MDTLPIVLSAVCQNLNAVKVSQIQDASVRRVPFQRKIGTGQSLEEFETKKKHGDLRHVGLTESMQMIASRIGWKLDRAEAGMAAGVQQIGRVFVGPKKRQLSLSALPSANPFPKTRSNCWAHPISSPRYREVSMAM